ncbi:hypothetical protein E4U30_008211 [Claviceps sp. LM220 group G6]|nr:hypothetical protein E4U31_000581 [Claviceps sp. LM219 group G6]KAG6090258.1 hypothetical protein E4U30_008211 [Claviceps sp. LM220 group G6]
MQFFTLLLASASVGSAVAAPNPAPSPHTVIHPQWCNNGWTGDGSCEKAGLHTYCCNLYEGGEFVTWRNTQQQSSDGNNNWFCPNNGVIYCA